MSMCSRLERDETAGWLQILSTRQTTDFGDLQYWRIDGGELIHVLYTLMLGNMQYTFGRETLRSPDAGRRIFFHTPGKREAGGRLKT